MIIWPWLHLYMDFFSLSSFNFVDDEMVLHERERFPANDSTH
jgi:hypothetical protein